MMHSDTLMEIFAPRNTSGALIQHCLPENIGELGDVTREARAKAKAWKTSRAAIGGRRDVLGVSGQRVS
jgi:hypothetical protein